jgi:hypothetical protein
MSRHWQEILHELHDETHRDGYYCRANMLESIVDELIAEMEYAKVVGPIGKYQGVSQKGVSQMGPVFCKLPETLPGDTDGK